MLGSRQLAICKRDHRRAVLAGVLCARGIDGFAHTSSMRATLGARTWTGGAGRGGVGVYVACDCGCGAGRRQCKPETVTSKQG